MQEQKQQLGFSLIETIVATSIFVVTSIIILSLFISNSQLYKVQLRTTDIKIYKANFSREFTMITEAATNVETSRTISGIPYTSSSSTIIFKIPTQNISGDIINNTFDYAVFYLTNNKVYMETEANVASRRVSLNKLLADKVDRLIFRYSAENPAQANTVESLLYFTDSSNYIPVSLKIKLRNKSN